MQTIRIPKNLLYLSDKLPQPNYERVKSNDLPELRPRKKTKNRGEILQENLDNSIGEINPQIASIIKKKNTRDNPNENNMQLLKNSNSNNNNEEDVIPIKLIEKREKSPSG
jgi:hypothetical protein